MGELNMALVQILLFFIRVWHQLQGHSLLCSSMGLLLIFMWFRLVYTPYVNYFRGADVFIINKTDISMCQVGPSQRQTQNPSHHFQRQCPKIPALVGLSSKILCAIALMDLKLLSLRSNPSSTFLLPNNLATSFDTDR